MRPWLIGLGVVVALAVIVAGGVLGLYAAMRARFNPPPPQASITANATPLQAQRDDIAQFRRLIALDRSYPPAARQEAEAALNALAADDAVLPPPKFRLALMRIAAMADNGHTGAFAAPSGRPNAAPIRLHEFADGVRVLRADAADADLLGAELVSVEGRPAEATLSALYAFRGGTAGNRRHWAVQRALVSPEMLFGAGLAANPAEATYGFRLLDGRLVQRSLAGEAEDASTPAPNPPRWLSPQAAPGEPQTWRAFRPAGSAPAALADPDRAFRFVWVDNGCIAYIQLRANLDVGGQSIAAFLRQARRNLSDRRACGAVLDLRYDGGGDYTLTASFARALPRLTAPNARIALLTGVDTFSAGITTAAFVKEAGGDRVVILGEPVGDRLDFWSEGGSGCLPHAPLCFHYSTGRHVYDGPCTDWRTCYWVNDLFPVRVKTLDPDETIPLRFAEYRLGRDPVMERALAIVRPR